MGCQKQIVQTLSDIVVNGPDCQKQIVQTLSDIVVHDKGHTSDFGALESLVSEISMITFII